MAEATLFFVMRPDSSVTVALPDGLWIDIFRPRPWRLNAHGSRVSLLYAYWFLATRGRYEIWYVRDQQNQIVHHSHVLPKIPTFPFMGRRDLEIGPCGTDGAHRGRGIYPAVLRAIAARRTDADKLWVMTDTGNTPSIRGIEKAGFSLAGHGRKRMHFFLLERAV